MKIKKIVAGVLAIAFVVCTSAVTAKAASLNSVETATLGNVAVQALSRISSSNAMCSTSMTGTGVVSVTGTYYYVNFRTLELGSKTTGYGGQYGATVAFYAPVDCRSVRVNGSHRVSYGAQYWGASTEAIYR